MATDRRVRQCRNLLKELCKALSPEQEAWFVSWLTHPEQQETFRIWREEHQEEIHAFLRATPAARKEILRQTAPWPPLVLLAAIWHTRRALVLLTLTRSANIPEGPEARAEDIAVAAGEACGNIAERMKVEGWPLLI